MYISGYSLKNSDIFLIENSKQVIERILQFNLSLNSERKEIDIDTASEIFVQLGQEKIKHQQKLLQG